MKGDFSRITFDPANNFTQVLLQQGRVLLDADFNEQGAITAYALRQLIRDLLGPHAGPTDDLGFAITVDSSKLAIGAGRYYVDGLMVTNPDLPAKDGKPQFLYYDSQDGYPFPDSVEFKDMKVGGLYMLYLDVWQEHVTWLEDGAIREVALGGPDTTTRLAVRWQVRAGERQAGDKTPAEDWLDSNLRRHRWGEVVKNGIYLPRLQAATDPKDNPDETPCVADPLGGYRGLENQLYRIEIHQGDQDGGPATFKWSRDNGSVTAAWSELDGSDLVVEGIHDTVHGFQPGQWVELTDERDAYLGRPGVMVQLVKVDGDRLTFDPNTASGNLPVVEKMLNPLVRRWDHQDRKEYKLQGGAIVVEEGKQYPIEKGISITFAKALAGQPVIYRTGDYWTFAARTATADIEWPSTFDTTVSPPVRVFSFIEAQGVEHVYAPLATVSPKGAAAPDFDITSMQRKINKLWSKI